MKLFKLYPIESKVNDQDWLLSTTKETIIVRAQSKEMARQIAARVTGLARSATDNSPNPSPWLDDVFSSCDNYSGDKYKVDGEEEILSPLFLNKEWERMKKNNSI